MRRTLRLQRETLTELTPNELSSVVGGSDTTCYIEQIVDVLVDYLSVQVCHITGACTR